MLIVFRFFAGVMGSTTLSIGGGTFGDMFRFEERGAAVAVWSMGPLMGPVVGPIAGAFLAEDVGWRWVFWIIAMAVRFNDVSLISNFKWFFRLVF
jgi:MFS family permease